MRQALIDADVLLYEVGFAAEASWQQAGFPPFDYVAEMIHNRIGNICAMVESTEPPILYMTGATNFRNAIAKRVPYKTRASNKPWHYKNIKAYMKAVYDVRIQEGLEADDLMAIEQTRRLDETIVCSRDKDSLTYPGWKYSWECGRQPSFGPVYVDSLGSLRLSACRKKLSGTGQSFFYSQCLTGDKVDSIPGLDGMGAVGAFELLDGCPTIDELFKRVLEAYRGVYGPLAEDELLEQGRLLWMTRKLHPDGSPVLWELPNIQQ